MHDGQQGVQRTGLGVICYGDSLAAGHVQKSLPVEFPDTLVDGGLADFHPVGQLPLCGQPVSRAQLPGKNHSRDLLNKQLPDGGSHDFLEFHGGPPSGLTTTLKSEPNNFMKNRQ